MRKIGSLSDRARAEVLGAYLYSQGIENEIDLAKDESWAVWIRSDDKIDPAKQILSRFLANPDEPEFQKGAADAELRVKDELTKDERWRRNYRDRSAVFRTISMGTVTAVLIGFSIVIAIATNFGRDSSITNQIFLTSVETRGGWIYFDRSLPEIRMGQVWRVITPIFLHFGYLHLFFNMLWMYDLGGALERRHGSWRLLVFVFLVAVPSNLMQFFFGGPSFGGMSGVVYGLLGYFWIRPKVDPYYNLHLNSGTVMMMLIWFALGIALPKLSVANVVHGVGLIMGVLAGYLTGVYSRRRQLKG